MRVLSVTHGPSVGGGVFEDVAEESGHRLDRWLVPAGPAGAAPTVYDAIMVFGGAMHPDQDARHPWLAGETAFLESALEARIPLLGVCLGSQLIARAAGAAVRPSPADEIGWFAVDVTEEAADDAVLKVLPPAPWVFQWHSYTFELPAGAVVLATSPVCTQAYAIDGHAWGIQFHAEVTAETIDAWIDEEPSELPMPAADLRGETARRIAASIAQGRALAAAFLTVAQNGRLR